MYRWIEDRVLTLIIDDSYSPQKSKGMSLAETCGRPDCAFKKAAPQQDEFFVKRIIGKRVKVEGGRGRVEEYLVEWDG